MAGQVSKRWRSVVHHKAWRSLNKAVHLKPEFMGPKYKTIGWVENEHSWSVCKCINMARDLVFYDNIELMDADLKQVEKFSTSEDYPGETLDDSENDDDNDDDNEYIIDYVEANHVEEAEAFIRLAAAGIMTSLEVLTLADFDWTVVKNLSLLFKIVNSYIHIDIILEDNISGDLSKSAFNHINCWSLHVKVMNPRNTGLRIFTDADIESLNEVLNRVENFDFGIHDGYGSFFPIIEKYDGKGKCHMIKLRYNRMPNEEFGLEFEKVKEWATSRGWNVSEYEYADEGFSRKVVHLRRKFEDLLDDMKQFEDFLGKVLKKK